MQAASFSVAASIPGEAFMGVAVPQAAVLASADALGDEGSDEAAGTEAMEPVPKWKVRTDAERRCALMRFGRNGAKFLTGQHLQDFKIGRGAARARLFDLYSEKGEDWQQVVATLAQEISRETIDRQRGVRGWRDRDGLMVLYNGSEHKVDNVIAEKVRLGQWRPDPNGSGDTQYHVVLDTTESETVGRNLTTLAISGQVDAAGVRQLVRPGGAFAEGQGIVNMAGPIVDQQPRPRQTSRDEDTAKEQERQDKHKEREQPKEQETVKREAEARVGFGGVGSQHGWGSSWRSKRALGRWCWATAWGLLVT
jgi:hypothetical protein